MTPALIERAMAEIVRPTIAAMAARGAPFRGVLYAGLMITADGAEADRIQCPLRRSRDAGADDAPRQRSSRASLATVDGRLAEVAPPRWSDDAALTVVMAARRLSRRLSQRRRDPRASSAPTPSPGVKVFQAGTALARRRARRRWRPRPQRHGARARPSPRRRARAYAAVGLIDWPDGFLPAATSAGGPSENAETDAGRRILRGRDRKVIGSDDG